MGRRSAASSYLFLLMIHSGDRLCILTQHTQSKWAFTEHALPSQSLLRCVLLHFILLFM